MYRTLTHILLPISASLLLHCGCTGSGHSQSPSVPLTVIRLDSLHHGLKPDPDQESALASMSGFMGTDSISPADFASRLASSSAYQVFGPDVSRIISSPEDYLLPYNRALEAAESAGISMPDTIVTIISPYRQSVVIADGKVFVALNHFLGPDYPGYSGFPDEVRQLNTPDRISVSAAEALVRAQSDSPAPAQSQLIAAMAHEGAIYACMEQLLKPVQEWDLLGFTPDEIEWLHDNEANLWNALADREMLFSTDPALPARLLNSIQPDGGGILAGAPPRAARYIALQIGRHMMKTYPERKGSEMIDWNLSSSPTLIRDIAYHPR